MADATPLAGPADSAVVVAKDNGPRQRFFSGRTLVIAIPYLWSLVFFAIPFFIVFKLSVSQVADGNPPYTPVFSFDGTWQSLTDYFSQLNFDNYYSIFNIWGEDGDSLYIKSYFSSVTIAAISTFFLLLIGYPIAYGMARASKTLRPTLLMLVILPFWTSFLIRVYAWTGILKGQGLLNLALSQVGLVDMANPPELLGTNWAVYIGMVYSYLPFMVLPLYSTLEKMDHTLLEAAADLGCKPIKAFWLVTFPLSLPGVIAGCMLCFIPAVGEFVIPDLLGGSQTLMIGKSLFDLFLLNRDWPTASALAIILLVVLVGPITYYQHIQAKALEANR
ncbi:putrescine ABC transporter permease [Labrys miyagiensis]|uniref:Putrescine ABC transporter permease n=1 Tax=Labrys miyagiensis TaxID=346912 RepID=A0ABQ6CBS9_9HYPH|nr:ABC transporter permease subunit [Labrys miyagiensis]GLS17107.1 putrescine ABC transporter permease [Labrys miyagiensis]